MSKLKKTILYILQECGPMSLDKLEVMLYFADFDYYEKYEKPLFKNVAWVKKDMPRLTLRD